MLDYTTRRGDRAGSVLPAIEPNKPVPAGVSPGGQCSIAREGCASPSAGTEAAAAISVHHVIEQLQALATAAGRAVAAPHRTVYGDTLEP